MQPLRHLLLAAGAAAVLLLPPPADAREASAAPHVPALVEELRTGHVLLDVQTGKVLASLRGEEAFIPASVTKLPMALAILDILGPERRLTTSFVASGPVENGVVQGDLVLVGGGDPTLDGRALEAMAKELKGAGVTGITGRFLFDDALLPSLAAIDANQPSDAGYNPGLSGLALNYNRFKVKWDASGLRGADVPLDPVPVAYVPPVGHKKGEAWIPVRDAGLHAARVARWLAGEQGIALPEPQRGEVTGAGLVLVHRDSAPVEEMLSGFMRYSNNVGMEMLSLLAAKELGAAPTTLAEAAKLMAARADTLVPGASLASAVLPNASGLTEQGRMTPMQCAAAARHTALGKSRSGKSLLSLLPKYAVELEAPKGKKAKTIEARAKTGTIYYGRSLAGVFTGADGRQKAFCLMADDVARRAAYDAVPADKRELAPVKDPARRWLRRAREAENDLIARWYQGK